MKFPKGIIIIEGVLIISLCRNHTLDL